MGGDAERGLEFGKGVVSCRLKMWVGMRSGGDVSGWCGKDVGFELS